MSPELSPEAGSSAPPASTRDELIYQNERTLVYRVPAASGQGRCLRKKPIGPKAAARLHHERRILGRLSGVSGVLQPISSAGDFIVFADIGAVTLAQTLRNRVLTLTEQIAFMLQLAQIVADIHRAGVVHKDISPANLLFDAAQKLLLIDFDLATTFAEERPGFIQPQEIAGTLAYIAPEQTGRTGRSVDLRADLYALGAVSYEVVVGRPPFGDSQGDSLQLIYDILVRQPAAPTDLDLRVPRALSDIILRLLEKEPDRRYQSAEGLIADLTRLREMLVRGEFATFALGEHDYPLQLLPPSQLVGRNQEVGLLQAALDNALHGRGNCVLVGGAPGTGKSALINELRPTVTARRGQFVICKFDQFRQDMAADAVVQMLRAMFRVMLAEPEAELSIIRERLQRELAANIALLAGPIPELAAFFGIEPEIPTGDPLQISQRLIQSALDFVRASATPQRPLVMVMDDLQWAAGSVLQFVDGLVTDVNLRGCLLIGAYRDNEVDEAHPLHALFEHWQRLRVAPLQLSLQNLPPADLATLLAAMLRLSAPRALALAELIGAHTSGNPFDTVELVNALRRDRILLLQPDGWHWDAAAIRRYVGQSHVVDILHKRIERLPAATIAMLGSMACLGNEVETGLLAMATGLSRSELEQRIEPALEDGLVLAESDNGLRFRHDRVQQAAYRGLTDAQRTTLHLEIARRLATKTGLLPTAAEQYMAAIEAVEDAAERDRVVDVLSVAAVHARSISNYQSAENLLRTALRFVAAGRADDARKLQLQLAHHAVLYSLGRFDEADLVYASIVQDGKNLFAIAEATSNQVCSLTNRGRYQDAVAAGHAVLKNFGVVYPQGKAAEVQADIVRRMRDLSAWVDSDRKIDSKQRREAKDAQTLATAQLINRISPSSFFADPLQMAWLIVKTRQLWEERGCCAAMMTPLATAGFMTIAMLDDYRTGYAVVRHTLTVSEQLGYTTEAAEALYVFTAGSKHWFEPLEASVVPTQQAREGLLKAGILHSTALAYIPALGALLDTAPLLDQTAAELESGLLFVEHVGNGHAQAVLLAYRQFLRTLRGETTTPGDFDDADFTEAAHVAAISGNLMATAYFHLHRALAAAIFGREEQLARSIDAAQPVLPYVCGFYVTALAQLLSALSYADRARAVAPDARQPLLAEIDKCCRWMAARAADQPTNFLHLWKWIEAERSWAGAAPGDVAGNALAAFDSALTAASEVQRPWHQALMYERAGRCHAEQGLQISARGLLAESQRRYQAWGATAKAAAMVQQHDFLHALQTFAHGSSSSSMTADSIDLVGIVRASQALSSETHFVSLRQRMSKLLGELTGATHTHGALWYEDMGEWRVPAPTERSGDIDTISIEEAAETGALALSVFNYVLRTREPLLVNDALRDDRFANDPFFADMAQCSLLGLPVFYQGMPRLVLILENRQGRGAFSPHRLEAVQLIAGQLAISIANVQLYASLERKVAERTEALKAANRQLAELSITDALTGLANRRRFDTVLDAEWHRAVRPGHSLGLVLIDIDEFKLYNDHYGHQGGDECLRRVAHELRGSVRGDTDLAARYGGEEFVMVLPGADLDAARIVAERARRVIEQLHLPHVKAARGTVTISVGVAAVIPTAEVAANTLIEAADAALYLAKKNGRNRVEPGY